MKCGPLSILRAAQYEIEAAHSLQKRLLNVEQPKNGRLERSVSKCDTRVYLSEKNAHRCLWQHTTTCLSRALLTPTDKRLALLTSPLAPLTPWSRYCLLLRGEKKKKMRIMRAQSQRQKSSLGRKISISSSSIQTQL